ncbi:HAD-IA family hydrolase [Catenovulum sp. SM1970]|nr:HAD-IA family hydrolase [Marinifaba aquimaris]
MQARRYKLVIFDWDGTLMDSIGRIVSSMQKAAEHAKVTVPDFDTTKSIIGLSLPVAVKTLFPEATPSEQQLISDTYKSQYVSGNDMPAPLFEGVDTLLNTLSKSGIKLAVATGKSRVGLERVLKDTGFTELFISTRCADECRSKPDPQMLEQILAELSIDSKDAVFIGDTIFDLQMATAAGMDSIGVTIGVANEEQLIKEKPKAIFNSIEELTSYLAQ